MNGLVSGDTKLKIAFLYKKPTGLPSIGWDSKPGQAGF